MRGKRDIEDRIRAVTLGHAVADALGVPVEFISRRELDLAPVTDMLGFGTYHVPAGSWSDDTSMALATMDALKGAELDLRAIMDNFVGWVERAEFTPTDSVFDIGGTCSAAINNYIHGNKPTACGLFGEHTNGNGSLMRIYPVSLFLYYKGNCRRRLKRIHEASSLTHAHPRSKIACGIFSFVLWELLDNPCRASVGRGLERACRYYARYCGWDFPVLGEGEVPRHSRARRVNAMDGMLFERSLLRQIATDAGAIPRDKIGSSGYVLDTLEAALWCLLTTDSYKECVLRAVNLGEDTDTTAAVAGALAGALYGVDAIPAEWIGRLGRLELIEDICRGFADSL